MLQKQFSIIKEFQEKYPDSHVGGSIGLFLHGIDLQRDISKSDIDLTISKEMPDDLPFKVYEDSSNPEDFDYSIRVYDTETSSVYTKLEMTIRPDAAFQVIAHEGIEYNVSLKEDIIFWKRKYADKGVFKHIADLAVIETGTRPIFVPDPLDDFPF